MLIHLRSYIGRELMIIYMDRSGRLSQRRIEVKAVEGDKIQAYCHAQQAPRAFRQEGILSAIPVERGSIKNARRRERTLDR